MNMTLTAPQLNIISTSIQMTAVACGLNCMDCMDAAASPISTAFNHGVSTYVDPISEIK